MWSTSLSHNATGNGDDEDDDEFTRRRCDDEDDDEDDDEYDDDDDDDDNDDDDDDAGEGDDDDDDDDDDENDHCFAHVDFGRPSHDVFPQLANLDTNTSPSDSPPCETRPLNEMLLHRTRKKKVQPARSLITEDRPKPTYPPTSGHQNWVRLASN